jgi:hypothetical protein
MTELCGKMESLFRIPVEFFRVEAGLLYLVTVNEYGKAPTLFTEIT